MRYVEKTVRLSRRELTIGFLTGAISAFFGIGRIGSQPAKPVTTENLKQSALTPQALRDSMDGGFLVPPEFSNVVLKFSNDGVNWVEINEVHL